MRTPELIKAELELARANIMLREQAKQLAGMQHKMASDELPALIDKEQALQIELMGAQKNVDA